MDKSYFLSCDWGTSSFRLKLVDIKTGINKAEITSSKGIKEVFNSWQEVAGNEERLSFFQLLLQRKIEELATKVKVDLSDLPLVLSGMASSSIGMMELPYASCPLSLSKEGLRIKQIPSDPQFNHKIILVSGVETKGDVMRGEEIQVLGYYLKGEMVPKRFLMVLPGTHSKHIWIEDGRLIDFKTYMTGELFEILRTHSILKNSLSPIEGEWNPQEKTAFSQGVNDAANGNINHLLFTIRAKDLQQSLSHSEAAYYCSGLLIGQELKALRREAGWTFVLCCTAKLHPLYATAIAVLGLDENSVFLTPQEVEQLVVWGQMGIVARS